MRKLIFAITAITLFAFVSCKKSAPAISYPYGSWTFNNTTFKVTSCAYDSTGIDLAALDSFTDNKSCNLIVYFNQSLPAANGSYTVVPEGATPGAGQVSLSLGYVAPGVLDNYLSTGGGGNEKVNVTVANGKVNVSGSGIEMVNIGLGTDSNTLTFNITQTQ